jgi:hypothetical protein
MFIDRDREKLALKARRSLFSNSAHRLFIPEGDK